MQSNADREEEAVPRDRKGLRERYTKVSAMTAEILQHLETVERERAARDADPAFRLKVVAIKRYQQLRFERTYGDLLASRRYGAAARFFLDDLYGPIDFRARDQQFARIVPKIGSLFPAEVSATVLDLARLHAVSEILDSQMARVMNSDRLQGEQYMQAWQLVGQPHQRERQLKLVLEIGQALDRFTRHAWIVAALKLMRAPARAAGLSDLQSFLEAGMASFRSMGGATEFLETVRYREAGLISALFAGDPAVLNDLPG